MVKLTRIGASLLMALTIALPTSQVWAQDNDENQDKKDSKGIIVELVESAKGVVKSHADAAKDDAKSSVSELIKSSDSKTKSTKGNKVVTLSISGNIEERGSELVLFGQQPESLKKYLDTMRQARLDDDVSAVVLRFAPNSMGFATAQEMREGVNELRKRGKKVVALLEDDSQASYLVASAADEIAMPPTADIMLHGVNADSYFLKGLLDKVGVKMQVIHVGDYKSFGETFTQDEFTTPARKNMTEIVDSVFTQLRDTVAEGRKLSSGQVEEILNAGPISAEKAKELGLVDRVAYGDEVIAEMEDNKMTIVEADDYRGSSRSSSSSSSEISLLSLLSMMSKSDDSSSEVGNYPQVAVLYATGPITLGSSGGSGLGSSTEIASEDFIEELQKLEDNDKIKAVILRVNSPGGSAFASDLIWKKIEELKAKKPVVASMSDMAASGGYYISMGATKIVAQPGTLTGSIGVVGGKPNLQGLYDKIGVNKMSISRGKYAGMFSETRDFSEEEKSAVEAMMKRTYEVFVSKAATGRAKSFEELHEVAQGRVWTGEKAREVGLVDELGGMDKAITETKLLIGLKPDDKVRLVSYPREKSLVDIIQKALGTSSTTVRTGTGLHAAVSSMLGGTTLPGGLEAIMNHAVTIGNMLQQESVLTVMPVMINLK